MEPISSFGVEWSRSIKDVIGRTEFASLARLTLKILDLGTTGTTGTTAEPVTHGVGHARTWTSFLNEVVAVPEQTDDADAETSSGSSISDMPAAPVQPPIAVGPILQVPAGAPGTRRGADVRSPLVDVYVSPEAIEVSTLSLKVRAGWAP